MCHREDHQPGCSYSDDTSHRRKPRKKAFSKIKKWGRKRGGEEASALAEETSLGTEDKSAIKVRM